MKNVKTSDLLKASVAAIAVFGAATSSQAAVIDNSGITATASSQDSSNTSADKTLGVGLNAVTGEHGILRAQNWYADNNATQAGNSWIQWDLGALYTLESIQVWNANQTEQQDWSVNGIGTLDIYVSASATPGDPEIAGVGNGDNWTLWAENATFTKGPGTADYTGFDLETAVGKALPTADVRFVRFETDTYVTNTPNNSFSVGIGLAEIQFTAVPEPSSLALLGLGGLAMLRRRRA